MNGSVIIVRLYANHKLLKSNSNEKINPTDLLKRIFPIKYARTIDNELRTTEKNLAEDNSSFVGMFIPGIGSLLGLHKGGIGE